MIPYRTLSVQLPDVDDVFDPALRDGARTKAEAIYRRTDITDSLRAAAAYTVSAAFQQDSKFQLALSWADSAYRLRPTPQLQTHMSRLRQSLGN
ncbi:MAG: hypothetical protein IPK12_11325 [Gemmatimonadetes bacterium]|nr:hypothetical protein [Gemmatimonadota bacterium]